MKCYYRDRECDKVDNPKEMGSKPRTFCDCCLMGKLIDVLERMRKRKEAEAPR